eukprot:1417287-Amphidinium_carterae.1
MLCIHTGFDSNSKVMREWNATPNQAQAQSVVIQAIKTHLKLKRGLSIRTCCQFTQGTNH